MPLLVVDTVAPGTKLVPVRVTGTLAPWVPLAGLTEVRVGGAGLTVKASGPLAPPAGVTVMVAAPRVALRPMWRVAVIWVALTTVTLLAQIPVNTLIGGSLVDTVAPETKLAPVRVTGTPAPWTPLDGLTEVRVGAGANSPAEKRKENGSKRASVFISFARHAVTRLKDDTST